MGTVQKSRFRTKKEAQARAVKNRKDPKVTRAFISRASPAAEERGMKWVVVTFRK